jgi:hypothetical protein
MSGYIPHLRFPLLSPIEGARRYDASVERAKAQLALALERRAERRAVAVVRYLRALDAPAIDKPAE